VTVLVPVSLEERAAAIALATFARAHPPDAGVQSMVKIGLRAGYPRCCALFYAAVVPLRWAGERLANVYFDGPAARAELGYVPCPRCLGVVA
jgi:hypothetical protein